MPDGKDRARSRFLPPEHELDERFVLSGGPGGQHANRSQTAVQLRFDAQASDWLTRPVRERLLKLAGSRASNSGVIIIEASDHRSQHQNRTEARKRLAALIERAHERPAKRIPTRPTRAAKKRRIEHKRRRKQIKRNRKPPRMDE